MRTDTETLISALRVLQREIQCDDGAANAVVGEAADRLEELDVIKKAIFAGGFDLSPCMSCGSTVVCIPDGMPMCMKCAESE